MSINDVGVPKIDGAQSMMLVWALAMEDRLNVYFSVEVFVQPYWGHLTGAQFFDGGSTQGHRQSRSLRRSVFLAAQFFAKINFL